MSIRLDGLLVTLNFGSISSSLKADLNNKTLKFLHKMRWSTHRLVNPMVNSKGKVHGRKTIEMALVICESNTVYKMPLLSLQAASSTTQTNTKSQMKYHLKNNCKKKILLAHTEVGISS